MQLTFKKMIPPTVVGGSANQDVVERGSCGRNDMGSVKTLSHVLEVCTVSEVGDGMIE